MSDDTRRSPPERPVESASRQRVGWREILTREYLPQLLTLCLAIWLFAAFVPPALLGNVIAWRFGNRIGAGSAS